MFWSITQERLAIKCHSELLGHACTLKLFKELKNDLEILANGAIFKLWIKTVKIMFWSITQERLALLQIKCHFWASWTSYSKISQKGVVMSEDAGNDDDDDNSIMIMVLKMIEEWWRVLKEP